MDQFKNILKKALQAKSKVATLEAGQPTSFDKQPDGVTLDNQVYSQILKSIFKTESITEPTHQKFQIVGIGNIEALADSDKMSLFFPPHGAELFQTAWQEATAPAESSSQETSSAASMFGGNDEEEESDESPGFVPEEATHEEPETSPPEEAQESIPFQAEQGPTPAPTETPEPEPVAQQSPAPAPIPIRVPSKPAPSTPENSERISFTAETKGSTVMSKGHNPIDKLLRDLIEKKASDLHINVGEPICMRIDGSISRSEGKPITPAQMEQWITPITPTSNYKEFAEIHDTDFAYEILGLSRFRVNVYRTNKGVGAVLRVIPTTILTMEQLGVPPVIHSFCKLSKGLVVVTGPTGSGKSTTLAAMIDWINKNRPEHILTIEDPVEFVHHSKVAIINHREVGRHTGSFSRALKAALREDPDIILIGEMRDLETIAIAIETAETGHLVFGTLHTTTAISTVDRIVDQFPADTQEQIRMMLSSSLKGVVAQTLCKKIGGGRVAAHEILVVDDAASAMIREGKTHMVANHMQTQGKFGNKLLNDALLDLVQKKTITAEEALLKSIDKKSMSQALITKGLASEAEMKKAS